MTDIRTHQAVVLGSGVYAGSWLKAIACLLQDPREELAGVPLWLFSDGPTGAGALLNLMKGWRFPDALRPMAERIQARDMVLFHGVLDLGKLNFAEKLLLKAMKAPRGISATGRQLPNGHEPLLRSLNSHNKRWLPNRFIQSRLQHRIYLFGLFASTIGCGFG